MQKTAIQKEIKQKWEELTFANNFLFEIVARGRSLSEDDVREIKKSWSLKKKKILDTNAYYTDTNGIIVHMLLHWKAVQKKLYHKTATKGVYK